MNTVHAPIDWHPTHRIIVEQYMGVIIANTFHIVPDVKVSPGEYANAYTRTRGFARAHKAFPAHTFLPRTHNRSCMSKNRHITVCAGRFVLHLLERLLKLSLPVLYTWLLMFLSFFHYWMRLLAEITR